jgi:hypothetical protein
MKKFYFFVSAALMALVFVLAGCEHQAEEAGSDNKIASEYEPPDFTGIVSSAETGIIGRGEIRQFTLDTDIDAPVTWTVTGNVAEGEGEDKTSISEDGLLTVGKKEDGLTLIVRAESGGEELGTAAVKIKIWKDITANLDYIIADGKSDSVGGAKYAGITAAAYGNGTWVVAGYSADNWYYPALAWSKDDGDTWTRVNFFPGLVYNESINSIIYDGPPGGKQFIIAGNRNNTSGDIHRSTDGVTWKRVRVMPSVLSGGGTPRHMISRLVYGEVEGGGIYVATNGVNIFAYSSDGITWTNSDAEGNKLEVIKGSSGTYTDVVVYGSGLVDGKRVAMFRAWGLDTNAATKRMDVYSTTGTSWTRLTPEEAAAQHFIPIVPDSYGYGGLGLRDMDITKGSMFTGVIFRADGNKTFSGISPGPSDKYSPCPDDGSVYIYDDKVTGTPPYKYNNYVAFIAPGGNKYLAVGVGNRAAIAHAEAFD